MARDKSAHVAAPVSCVIGGKTYLLTPPTILEAKMYERYLQDQVMEGVKPLLDGLPDHLQRVLIEKAWEDRSKIRLGTRAYDEAATSPGNIFYLLWLALHKRQPELSLEQVQGMVNGDNVATIMEKLAEMVGIDPLESKAKAT